MGKQKIYKSLFSILLTGICVTAVTYAASVSYIKDGEVLTESYMTSLVNAINSKANLSDIYTKAQVDSKIQSLENKVKVLEDSLSDTEETTNPIGTDCPEGYIYDTLLNKCEAVYPLCIPKDCPTTYSYSCELGRCVYSMDDTEVFR